MKKALIPALVVVSGAMASSLWRTVELRCDVTQVEVAGTIAGPLLRCLGQELLTSETAEAVLSSEQVKIIVRQCRFRDGSFVVQ